MLKLFLAIAFKKCLIILSVTRSTKLIIALAMPAGVPMTVLNEKRETPLPAPDKASIVCQHIWIL